MVALDLGLNIIVMVLLLLEEESVKRKEELLRLRSEFSLEGLPLPDEELDSFF